jgi:uncharacterized protein (DUF1778 family)
MRTEFMLDSAHQPAIDAVLDQRLFVLDAEQYDAFVRVLDSPPPAGSQLRALLKKRPLWEKRLHSQLNDGSHRHMV